MFSTNRTSSYKRQYSGKVWASANTLVCREQFSGPKAVLSSVIGVHIRIDTDAPILLILLSRLKQIGQQGPESLIRLAG